MKWDCAVRYAAQTSGHITVALQKQPLIPTLILFPKEKQQAQLLESLKLQSVADWKSNRLTSLDAGTNPLFPM